MGGFKKFLLRGNIVDLAVAVVVGVAFNAVVQGMIKDLITPLIAAIGGEPRFSGLSFTVHHSTFNYGDFINAVVSFLVIATVAYYLVVLPATRISALAARQQVATTRSCPECLSDIPLAATRCKFCTAQVSPVPEPQPTSHGLSVTDRLRPIWRPHSK